MSLCLSGEIFFHKMKIVGIARHLQLESVVVLVLSIEFKDGNMAKTTQQTMVKVYLTVRLPGWIQF